MQVFCVFIGFVVGYVEVDYWWFVEVLVVGGRSDEVFEQIVMQFVEMIGDVEGGLLFCVFQQYYVEIVIVYIGRKIVVDDVFDVFICVVIYDVGFEYFDQWQCLCSVLFCYFYFYGDDIQLYCVVVGFGIVLVCQCIEVVVDYVEGIVQVFLVLCVLCQVGEVGCYVCVVVRMIVFVEIDVFDGK